MIGRNYEEKKCYNKKNTHVYVNLDQVSEEVTHVFFLFHRGAIVVLIRYYV